MAAGRRWTEEETKRSLYLYFQTPFGRMHATNPEIIALAKAIDRSPDSVAMKLCNFASLDPKITESGRKGLEGATKLDRQIWAEFNDNWTALIMEVEALEPTETVTTRGTVSAFRRRSTVPSTVA